MDELELQSIVRSAIDDAASFIDSEISPLRAKAAKYYNAEPFGDEKDGRSKVVSQDVRDTVQAIMPSLLRIFFGSERVVEYSPRSEEDAQMAEQATEYVQYLLTEENPGFMVFHSWFKDGLTRKTGIIKFWASDERTVEAKDYEGLDETQAAGLQTDPSIQITAIEQAEDGTFKISTRMESGEVKIRIAAVPPEEFLISRDATSLEQATLAAHRTKLTKSDLIAMGYDEETIEECGSDADALETNQERIERAPWLQLGGEDSANPAMRRIAYAEAFIKVDFDGDGIAELRKVCVMGNKIVHNQPAAMRPFAILCPDPEPHLAIGNSVADAVMDIQRIKSQVWRGMLDSLSQAIDPRTGVVEGQVNLDDVLNNEVGGIIRMRQPGAVVPFVTPFVGQSALPVLQLLDEMRESRTGITKASQGLSADVLQSTTKAAVAATVTAAQEHIEMIARIFAETGMKDLFRGLLRLVVTHQDKERMIRLRNKFVAVNPSKFDPMMDVTIAVGLGGGTREDKIQTLMGIKETQEGILQTLGPQNPIVTVQQYANTLRKIVELSGFPDASRYFNAPPADYQPPTPQAPEDPQAKTAMILAQVEQDKTRAKIQNDLAELELKREEMHLTDARERYRIESDARVKLADIQSKYHADMGKVLAGIETENQRIQAEERATAAAPAPQENVQ